MFCIREYLRWEKLRALTGTEQRSSWSRWKVNCKSVEQKGVDYTASIWVRVFGFSIYSAARRRTFEHRKYVNEQRNARTIKIPQM